MYCGRCKQNRASIKIMRNEGSRWVEVMLCKSCAEQTGATPAGLASPLLPLLQNLALAQKAKQSDPDASHKVVSAHAFEVEAQCPGCGYTFAAYRKNLMLGCPACYSSFEEQLRIELLRIHGSVKHAGRTPRIMPSMLRGPAGETARMIEPGTQPIHPAPPPSPRAEDPRTAGGNEDKPGSAELSAPGAAPPPFDIPDAAARITDEPGPAQPPPPAAPPAQAPPPPPPPAKPRPRASRSSSSRTTGSKSSSSRGSASAAGTPPVPLPAPAPVSMEELRRALKEAVAEEDYDRAALLHAEIRKRETPASPAAPAAPPAPEPNPTAKPAPPPADKPSEPPPTA